ncbi:eCIS core domain-containing protein [Streptomyces herbicida]|uniref:eCIS core domain-containing protein n=1 Tax=Streptomyces herbicida TaxID=3065675 RepID=UPI00292EC0B6|nr:DUF4157 domain-containing protein [Streptomyces sp. NEAU-HV9]
MNSQTRDARSEQTAEQRRRRRKERAAKSRTPEPKNIVSGAGQPLDPGVRRELEEQLGHDLSRVRLHTGRDAGQLAELLGADAVAVGQDILFREGAFKPGTVEGRRLLAHELLHTVQNPHGLGALRAGRELGAVSLPQQAIEREAETAAQDLVRPRSAPVAEPAPQVEQGQATPGWLRYATVDADRTRAERIDPESLVDRLVNDVLRSLRGDPEDASGRVRQHLGRMSPDLQDLVLDRLEIRLPTPEHDRLLDLVDEVEEGPLPLEAATAPHALPDASEELERERESEESAWQARLDNAERLEDERIAEAQRRKAEDPGAAERSGTGAGTAPRSGAGAGVGAAPPQPASSLPSSAVSAEPSQAKPLQVEDGSRDEGGDTVGNRADKAGDGGDKAPEGRSAASGGAAGAGSQKPASAGTAAAKDSSVRRTGAVRPEPVDRSAVERDDTRTPAREDTAPGTDQDPDDEPLGLETGGAAEALAELEDLLDDADAEPERGPRPEDAPLPSADTGTVTDNAVASGRTSAADAESKKSGRPPEPRVTAEEAEDLASALEEDAPQEDSADDDGDDAPDTEADPADQRVGPDPESEAADRPEPAAAPGPDAKDDQADRADRADRAEERDLAAETRRANERAAGGSSGDGAPRGEETAPGKLARADEDARGQETGSPAAGGGGGGSGSMAPAPARAPAAVAGSPAPAAAASAPGPAAGGDTGVSDHAVEMQSATPGTEAPPRHEPARQDDDTPVVARSAAPRARSGGGSTGGGGRAAATPKKKAPAPDVGNATPEAGLSVAESLQPHQALTALKGVDTAVGRSVDKERGALEDAPPSMDRPVGSPRTVHGGPKPGEPGAYTSEQVRETEAPRGSTPEIKGEKTPDGQLPGADMEEPGWWDITIAIGGALARKLLSKLLPLDKLTDSINELPTADKGLQGTKVGDAPKLPLKDDSDPQRTDKQARLLDDKSAELHESGRDDAARPMGEDEIYPDVPRETLTADLGGGKRQAGGEGGPAGSPSAGLPPEAVSAVAEHEQGPQIKQAFGQARQKMTAARKDKDDKARQDRGQYERDVRQQVDANAKEQADARDEGRTDIARSRDGWRKEQDDKLDEVDGKKSKKFTKVRQDVKEKQDKTDQDVDQRTKDDQKKIDDKRDGSEQEVQQKRDDGKKDSGNWFEKGLNWIKDQFNKLKQAIKDVFEKARNYVLGVIDDFKKQVFKFIDDARKWVIDQINAFADELIRLGDDLLKDYPAMQAKWRRTINGLRDAAVRKVNQAADKLKKIAGTLIDAFGGMLLAGLDLMEQGLLAAVNLAETVTVKAMELGAAILKGLGEWAAIATDILSDPGGWLGKAKDAAVTGAKAHLFTEIKSAVREWFNQKIQQLIGIPMEMFNWLISGGVSKEEMARMAWDEVVPQLPMIIGELIVTKVVAKLIPGAGWVMAVIDALKTAYEALSSVLRAFGLFMNFLKSVKSGNGALPFAKAVASGVVALLELIYQWLVAGIGKYLGKVARSLRERAGKLFGKGRPGADAPKKDVPKKDEGAPRRDDPASRPAAPKPHRPEPEPTPGRKPEPTSPKARQKPDEEDRRRDGRYANAADRGVKDAAHEAKHPTASRPDERGPRRPGDRRPDRTQDRPGTKRPNDRRPDGKRPDTTKPGDKRRPDLRKPDRKAPHEAKRDRTGKGRDRREHKDNPPRRRRPLQRVRDAVRKALAKVRRATRALLGKARDLRNRLRNLAKRLRDKWQRMKDRLLGRQRHERDRNRKDQRDRNATQDVDLPKVHFTDREDGEPHTLMFHGRGRRAPLFIHSTPEEAPAFLADWKADLRKPEAAADKAKQEGHLTAAERRYAEAKEIQRKIPSPIKKEDREKYRPLFTELRLKMAEFGDWAALRTHYDVPTPPDYPKWFDVKSPRGSAGHHAGFLSDAAKTVFGGPGKEAGEARTGQPPGWLWLRSKRMTTGSAWVRMHLLPERLGGDASGNNLVPARGPQTNIDFLNNIEDRAYRDIPKQEKIIWYRTEVQFNHAEWPDFPSRIHAEYGGYTKVGGTGKNRSDWSPKGVKWQHTQNPQPPREDEEGMLFINSAGRTTLQSVLKIGPRLADYVVEMRDKLKKGGSKFDNLGQFKLLMRARKRELGDRAMPDIEVLFVNLAKLDTDENKVDWN